MSSRPRTAAPPRVAISRASRAVIHSCARSGSDCDSQRNRRGPSGGSRSKAEPGQQRACRASSRIFEASLLADPSTPRPTFTPAARYS